MWGWGENFSTAKKEKLPSKANLLNHLHVRHVETETTQVPGGILRANLPSYVLDSFANLIFKKFVTHKLHLISFHFVLILALPVNLKIMILDQRLPRTLTRVD